MAHFGPRKAHFGPRTAHFGPRLCSFWSANFADQNELTPARLGNSPKLKTIPQVIPQTLPPRSRTSTETPEPALSRPRADLAPFPSRRMSVSFLAEFIHLICRICSSNLEFLREQRCQLRMQNEAHVVAHVCQAHGATAQCGTG